MSNVETVTLYTSAEVCKYVGCTYRQLDYWTRQGAVVPSMGEPEPGSGRQRLWTAVDIHALKVLFSHYCDLKEEIDRIMSGEMWRELH